MDVLLTVGLRMDGTVPKTCLQSAIDAGMVSGFLMRYVILGPLLGACLTVWGKWTGMTVLAGTILLLQSALLVLRRLNL